MTSEHETQTPNGRDIMLPDGISSLVAHNNFDLLALTHKVELKILTRRHSTNKGSDSYRPDDADLMNVPSLATSKRILNMGDALLYGRNVFIFTARNGENRAIEFINCLEEVRSIVCNEAAYGTKCTIVRHANRKTFDSKICHLRFEDDVEIRDLICVSSI